MEEVCGKVFLVFDTKVTSQLNKMATPAVPAPAPAPTPAPAPQPQRRFWLQHQLQPPPHTRQLHWLGPWAGSDPSTDPVRSLPGPALSGPHPSSRAVGLHLVIWPLLRTATRHSVKVLPKLLGPCWDLLTSIQWKSQTAF